MKAAIKHSWRVPGIIVVALVIVTLTLGRGTMPSVRAEGDLTAPMAAPVLVLYNEGIAALLEGDLQTAREKFQAALEQAHALGDGPGIVALPFALWVVYTELQQYPQALDILSTALSDFAAITYPGALVVKGLALTLIGATHVQMGNKASAFEAFDQGLPLLEQARETFAEQELRLIWPQRVDVFELAGKVLRDTANIYRLKMRAPQEAVRLYAEAYALFRDAGRLTDATWVRLWLGWSHMEAGQVQEATSIFSAVIKEAENAALPELIVRGYHGLGWASEAVGAFEQALAHYHIALQRLRESKREAERTLEPDILLKMGKLYRELTRYEEAIEYCWMAAMKYQEAQGAQGEAEALTRLADILLLLGDSRAALQYDERALELYKKTGNLPKQVEVLAALAEATGLGSGSVKYLQEGLELLASLEKAQSPEYIKMKALMKEAAQEKTLLQEKNEQLWRDWMNTLGSVDPEFRMAAGTLYQKMGRVALQPVRPQSMEGALAAGVISLLEQAEAYHESLPFNRDIAFELVKDLLLLGEAYRKVGNLERSLIVLHAAEAMAARLQTPEIYLVYASLAKIYRDLKNTDQAVLYALKTLDILESVQASQGLEETKMGILEGTFDVYRDFVGLLLDVYGTTGEVVFLQSAFLVNEMGRARAFLDMLGKSRATYLRGELGKLAAKHQQIQHEMARIHAQLRVPKLDTTKEGQLLDRLEQLRENWRSVQHEATQQSSKYAQLGWPHPRTGEEVQSTLDADTVLLEYSISPERSTLWAVTKEQIRTYSLPGLEELTSFEQYLKSLRTPLIGEEEVFQHIALGRDLFRILVGPAESQIRRKKHLIIVPDGPLYYLPFEALILPAPHKGARQPVTLKDAHYLIKQFRVSYAPSASMLVAQRRAQRSRATRASRPLVAFGDPLYQEANLTGSPASHSGPMTPLGLRATRWNHLRDAGVLNRLAFAGEEVRRIARIWGIPLHSAHINLQQRATVERVRELNLAQYRIVHFAAHGVMEDDLGLATQPALVLSPGRAEGQSRGLLQFADIIGLKLKAELVVLSACNTGLGRLRAGEGIVGLTRAFLYAGASSVVVSLWQVEDQSTSLLMEHFYRYLKQGQSKAEALHQAKLRLLEATITLQALGQRQSLAAPFYWAPFVLVGDWR
jgi:CHAT domain-containing protein